MDSFALSIRNVEGDFLYTETRVLKHVSVIDSQMKAIKMVLDDCFPNNQVPLIIETDSLLAQ